MCAFFVRGDGSCLEMKCLIIALRSRSLIWICYDDGCLLNNLLSTLGRLVGFTGLGFFLFYTLAGAPYYS